MKIVVYAYYSRPWNLQSGDDIRIHYIVNIIKDAVKKPIIIYNLSHLVDKPIMMQKDGIVYVSIPRKFYNLVAKLLRWKQPYDLNPLIKLTHYIDELITATKLARVARQAKIIYIFGSMTLFSLFIRLLGVKSKIIYDPLANYAQTLYLRSRESFQELLKYGLYLALHKLQLKSSDHIIYPSRIDLENAERMFKVIKTSIIPNIAVVCYRSIDEYIMLRRRRKDFRKLYFILLAGGKGKQNKRGVIMTINVFNKMPSDKFKLFITGPWLEMKKYLRNPSIKLLGVVPLAKVKELLAISDYGLSPIFDHSAGTFLKIITYLVGGLAIIGSPRSMAGIDKQLLLRSPRIITVQNLDEYRKAVEEAIKIGPLLKPSPLICNELSELYKSFARKLKILLENCVGKEYLHAEC